MSRENRRYFIIVSWKNGNAIQIHEKLVNVEGDQALSIATFRCWIVAFKGGEKGIRDKPHTGRPCEEMTTEKIAKVEDLVSDDTHISGQRTGHFT